MYYSYSEGFEGDIDVSAEHVLDIMYPERVKERERLEALKKSNKTEVNGTIEEINLDEINIERNKTDL